MILITQAIREQILIDNVVLHVEELRNKPVETVIKTDVKFHIVTDAHKFDLTVPMEISFARLPDAGNTAVHHFEENTCEIDIRNINISILHVANKNGIILDKELKFQMITALAELLIAELS
jgi:hypothetical protein